MGRKRTPAGHRSKFEDKIQSKLDGRFAYEPFSLPYILSCSYTPDWVDARSKTLIEAKGRLTSADRRKMVAVKRDNPGWRIIFVFQDEKRTIAKNSKTTYRDWAIKNGFSVVSAAALSSI